MAASCRRRFRKTVIKEDGKRERVFHLTFGGCAVRFPGSDRRLYLVVIDGFGGKDPLMLLTTMEIGRSKKRLWRVVESYLARWRVEETIRFIKQSSGLEDIRLLTYKRLRTMTALVMAAAYFACVFFGSQGEAQDPGAERLSGGPPDLWHSRISFLRHCRRDQGAALRTRRSPQNPARGHP